MSDRRGAADRDSVQCEGKSQCGRYAALRLCRSLGAVVRVHKLNPRGPCHVCGSSHVHVFFPCLQMHIAATEEQKGFLPA